MSDAMNYAVFADLYDSYVRLDFDFDYFTKEAKQVSGPVLELMSGTGRLSIPLIEAGTPLVCVDASPEMLHILQEKLRTRGLHADTYLQDVRELDLGRKFELAFIPFHAFAELIDRSDQIRTLARIREHLAVNGRLIVTLHNPPVRLARVDGALRLWAQGPRRDQPGKLLVFGQERYDPDQRIVEGMQFFEEYDPNNLLQRKRYVDMRFRIIYPDEFQALAQESGFQVAELYGNYAYGNFDEDKSPVMIWVLEPSTEFNSPP